ncbi:MAG: hypothetical protein KatS3mg022_1151 [Armatimonadota bacterium]|nr:MAG: hypothetical protein KatS3mg022_1151 [Armatimonadota bacterium]
MRSSRWAVAVAVWGCTLGGWLTASAGQFSPAGKSVTFYAEWRLRYEDRACTDFCSVNQKDPQIVPATPGSSSSGTSPVAAILKILPCTPLTSFSARPSRRVDGWGCRAGAT